MNKNVNVEIQLRGDLILRLPKCEHYLRLREEDFSDRIQMAMDFLQAATGVSWPDEEPLCDDSSLLQDYLIKILEEKFGMSVREKK